jgi:uncharacterized membrane protein
MPFSDLQFFPLALPFFLILFFLIAILIGLIEIGILEYAYEKIGINRRYIFILLLLSLIGSYVNIPIMELPARRIVSDQVVTYFGMQYIIPRVYHWQRTVIAANLGGAIIPALLSVYLLLKNRIYGRSLIGTAIVALIVHSMAEPVPGVGIAIPVFIPPLVAAGTALLLSQRFAPPLAYISGSMGTLIGADLLNLGRIQELGAPVASIGGAGTFDGIFVTGILAVVLA